MHKRAGQMRYAKSTRKNARKRLQKRKDDYQDVWENSLNAILNGLNSLKKRWLKW